MLNSDENGDNLLNMVNPDEACGALPNPAEPVMDTGRISLRKFSGYPTEDPDQFISDFEAYCVFSRLNNHDQRKVAAFQLHLQGPAQTWFCCLDDDDKTDWDTLKDAFELKYSSQNNTPVLLVEAEQFSQLRLLPTQQIEDYYSRILDKGRKLHKSDQEVLLKFIQGLPHQLAFFVRAGNPGDIGAALTSAKMGEAYGYRATVDSTMGGARMQAAPVAAATKDASSDRIASLEKTVLSLGNKLETLLTSNTTAAHAQAGRTSGRRVPSRVCYACSGEGHVKRQCNLGEGEGDPSVTCQLCLQKGHNGKQCKLFVNTNSGNYMNPRNTGRGPLGGQ